MSTYVRGLRAKTSVLDDISIDWSDLQGVPERTETPKKVKVATGCPYCDLDNYSEHDPSEYDDYQHNAYYMVAKAPWTSLMMTHNSKTGKYGLVANGDYSPGVNIEFCPFCSRKLVEE